MIKMRLTFVDSEDGNKELNKALEDIKKSFNVIDTSKVYSGRNGSKYSNVYLDVEVK